MFHAIWALLSGRRLGLAREKALTGILSGVSVRWIRRVHVVLPVLANHVDYIEVVVRELIEHVCERFLTDSTDRQNWLEPSSLVFTLNEFSDLLMENNFCLSKRLLQG